MDDKEKRRDKWGIKRVILGEIKMRIARGVFLTLGWVIMGALAYVWLFTEGSDRTILIVVLVSLFIILSVEYVREGFAQRKSLPNKNIKCQCILV
ncbi:hypothetical protein E3J74_01915 [Candidatus Bathyarchaeota archaeon]|nr:MAG: hypothetical protein E3J74_01915 [Candidatus Bathyarchaeota archaeon]